MEWTVSQEESGLKLLHFLKDKLGTEASSRNIKRSIDNNSCFINGKVERFSNTPLRKGQKIRFEIKTTPLKSTFNTKDVIYEDEWLLVYNKMPGIVSDEQGLLKLLNSYDKNLSLAHRLDKDTSGLILLGKKASVTLSLQSLFKKREIQKSYLALVDGIPPKKKGIISNYLGKIHSYDGQSYWGAVEASKGLFAQTQWEVIKAKQGISLILCTPHTGRTHQIRVHLNSLSCPIIGDYHYCKRFKSKINTTHHLLHAATLRFLHPILEKEMFFQCPVPPLFKKYIP